jgi:DNA-directed RNA polymerase specialized sigma24 family protein
MPLSEKEKLVFDLKNGSYKAFETLYAEYFDLLYGYVFGLIRSHTQAKEIVQDTFIKALEQAYFEGQKDAINGDIRISNTCDFYINGIQNLAVKY